MLTSWDTISLIFGSPPEHEHVEPILWNTSDAPAAAGAQN